MVSTSRREGERYCIVLDTTDIFFEPPDHPMAYLSRVTALGMANEFEKRNACVAFRRCGSQHAALMYFGDERAPAFDTLFTLHHANEPRTGELLVRYILASELAEFQGNVAQECLPAT